MSTLLEEVGIKYSRKDTQGMKRFTYMSESRHPHHNNTPQQWDVWCFNEMEFKRLLVHWNRDQHWVYTRKLNREVYFKYDGTVIESTMSV
jgi:hypothetical protein